MSKTKWPKTVPVLEAKDMHKGSAHGPNDTHCIYGWACNVFPTFPCILPERVKDEAMKAIEQASGGAADFDLGIAKYNDSPKRPRHILARTWNRAMALLGYVVGNPEAKWANKQKRKQVKAK